MNSELLLAPKPQSIVETSTHPVLQHHLQIGIPELTDEFTVPAEMIRAALLQREVSSEIAPPGRHTGAFLRLDVDPSRFRKPQSYELVIEVPGIRLTGADPSGLFYGATTLRQILLTSPEAPQTSLPGLRIADEPDFAHRGVLLDVSRDRVPTMKTLFDLVDLLASWKINQLQLYTEHTFAYEGHEKVWEGSDPLTPDEIRALDDFCRARHVELVPNQQSFGHMHRWLRHEPYRHLAECPDGVGHPFHPSPEPFSLCPTEPASLDLLRDLYDQLLPNFSSMQLNVGLDETFDLGLGRSSDLCERDGHDRVYLDFLKAVHRLVSERGRRIQFWGDIIRSHPSLVEELPPDVIPLEWGYEGNHPFEENARTFGRAGLSFYVCPGTSSWNSLSGRTDNALANLEGAARDGHAAGAMGYLITDWGDNGHLQPLPVSYLGFLAGACCGWNVEDSKSLDASSLPRLLDAHAFNDRAGVMGRLAFDLGDIHKLMGAGIPNDTALFRLLMSPEKIPEDLPPQAFVRARKAIDGIMETIGAAKMDREDAGLIQREFSWVADMLRIACRVGSEAANDATSESTDEFERLVSEHRRLWVQRSRPGGLDGSCSWLQPMRAFLKD